MVQNSRAFIFVFLALTAILAGCSRNDSLSLAENSTGVKDDEILVGSSLALEGHAGYLGKHMLHGAMAYIRHINDRGGVNGRRINIIAMNDGYDPTLCLYNTQQLILEKKVFCLFNYVGTPTTVRIIPLVNEAGIPLLGMFTGANRLREPVNRLLINVRASYYQEIDAAVDLMIKKMKLDRIAVFYQYDEYGFDGLRGAEIALKKYGKVPVAKGSYVRGTVDVERGLEKIIRSDAQAVVMIGTYDSCSKFISLARRQGFSPLFYSVSFVGSIELARRLGPHGDDVIITQVVPFPDGSQGGEVLPGVKFYAELLKKYYPDDRPSFVGLEGFINAQILVEGLKRAGRDVTREKFIRAVESISGFDPGMDNPVSFGVNDYQGFERVYFTRIKDGELVLLK